MSEKLTPAKRLKQLRQSGWLEFVEFMEFSQVSPRDIKDGSIAIHMFRSKKASSWLAQDIEHDLFWSKVNNVKGGEVGLAMIGLAEQLAPKPTKKNKMVRRGSYR